MRIGEGDPAGHTQHIRCCGLLDGAGLDDASLLVHRNYNLGFCGSFFRNSLLARVRHSTATAANEGPDT